MLSNLTFNTAKYLHHELSNDHRVPIQLRFKGDSKDHIMKLLITNFNGMMIEQLIREMLERVSGYNFSTLESVIIDGNEIRINNMSNAAIEILCAAYEHKSDGFLNELLTASELTTRFADIVYTNQPVLTYVYFVFANKDGNAIPFLFLVDVNVQQEHYIRPKRKLIEIDGNYSGYDNFVKFDQATNKSTIITYEPSAQYDFSFDVGRIRYMLLYKGLWRTVWTDDKPLKFNELISYELLPDVPGKTELFNLVMIDGNEEGKTSTSILIGRSNHGLIVRGVPIDLSDFELLEDKGGLEGYVDV
jgi:hypothetical protein